MMARNLDLDTICDGFGSIVSNSVSLAPTQISNFKVVQSRLSNRDFKCQSGTSRLHRVCARNTPRTMFPPQESFSTNWEMRDLTAAERIGPFAADWVGRFPKVAFTVALINEHSAIYPL